jgi:hypothetical protein
MCIFVDAHGYMCLCIPLFHTHTHTHARMCLPVCMHKNVVKQLRPHTHTHTHTHTYPHTYTHTQPKKNVSVSVSPSLFFSLHTPTCTHKHTHREREGETVRERERGGETERERNHTRCYWALRSPVAMVLPKGANSSRGYHFPGNGISHDSRSQPHAGRALPGGVHGPRRDVGDVLQQLTFRHSWIPCSANFTCSATATHSCFNPSTETLRHTSFAGECEYPHSIVSARIDTWGAPPHCCCKSVGETNEGNLALDPKVSDKGI